MRRLSAVCLSVMLAAQVQAGVREAELTEPTTRYPHGVLGDEVEYGALRIVTDDGATKLLRLPDSRVFEDVTARLADLDQDGDQEIVVVESSQTQGARLAIYDEAGLVAATPFIGRRFRWLAPAAIADLDGDGMIEVAYVDRPHLAKTLRIWRFEKGSLRQVAEQAGLTNHRIGDEVISGGLRQCGGLPEMILMSADWRQIVSARFDGSQISVTPVGPYKGLHASQFALICE